MTNDLMANVISRVNMIKIFGAKFVVAMCCFALLALCSPKASAVPGVDDWFSLNLTVNEKGSDWLRDNTNIQASLVDSKGQPSSKPTALKITNAGKVACSVSSSLLAIKKDGGVVEPKQTIIFPIAGIKTDSIAVSEITVRLKISQSDILEKKGAESGTTGTATGMTGKGAEQPVSNRQMRIAEIDQQLKAEVEKLRLDNVRVGPRNLNQSP